MKKGFTLIELLAVIIILAIVALIATPIVLDVVEDAKDSAAKSEASMIVSGVNNYCAAAEMKEQLDGTESICKDGVTKEEVAAMVDLGNAKVNSITYDNKVTALSVESNDRTVTYNGSEFTIEKSTGETPEPTPEPTVGPYYAFGTPTTSSSTNYQDVITSSGSNVFVKLDDDQLSLCIYRKNTLECFENNNYEEESEHVQNVFSDEDFACGKGSDGVGTESWQCVDDKFDCYINNDGSVNCQDEVSKHKCVVNADDSVTCN